MVTVGELDAPDAITVPPEAWLGLILLIASLLAADLLLVNRKAHEVSLGEAAVSSAAWIACGVSFGLVVWWGLGSEAASQYYAGYLIEKSLSVDNVFLWAVLLGTFAVPRAYQHRVLFWGVCGALVLRGIFIFGGVALLDRFSWLVFVFGAFLVVTGIRVARGDDDDMHPEDSRIMRFLRRHMPMTDGYREERFFVREDGLRLATPLLAVLVLIELTDVVFAVDSIPAVLGISRSAFIAFSSNAFAILGLRALYFLLAPLQDRIVLLNRGIGVILGFVGVELLLEHWYRLETWISLGVISAILALTVAMSLRSTAATSG
jgi:tellurite resistance protein TerC